MEVQNKWTEQYFGGNKGMKMPGDFNTVGIIKHVYDDIEENEVTTNLKSKYGDKIVSCELMRKRSDKSFSGMIKVEFDSRGSLMDMIQDRISLGNQRYIVEEFRRKPRVIKCNKCQSWGHIHRYCTKAAKCGKCAGDHETISCEKTSGFKCAHCGKDHCAGSYSCEVFKAKLALFTDNSQYD